MVTKVAINGFGRIGRNVLRAIIGSGMFVVNAPFGLDAQAADIERRFA